MVLQVGAQPVLHPSHPRSVVVLSAINLFMFEIENYLPKGRVIIQLGNLFTIFDARALPNIFTFSPI